MYERECKAMYGKQFDAYSDLPPIQAVIYTIAILILTLALESIVHSKFDEKPAEPPTTTPANRYATPYVRATRLALALIIYPFILILFIMRIKQGPLFMGADCEIYIPSTYWLVISLVNFLPFACASTAFLRALVDCVLVRFDTGLSDTFSDIKSKEGPMPWMPVLPLFLVFVMILCVFEGLKVSIAWVMGKELGSLFTGSWEGANDIWAEEASREEEEIGLVEGMEMESEDEDEGSSAGPPAYDEVVRPLADERVKGRGDDVV
jgi:hypothetical protein